MNDCGPFFLAFFALVLRESWPRGLQVASKREREREKTGKKELTLGGQEMEPDMKERKRDRVLVLDK